MMMWDGMVLHDDDSLGLQRYNNASPLGVWCCTAMNNMWHDDGGW